MGLLLLTHTRSPFSISFVSNARSVLKKELLSLSLFLLSRNWPDACLSLYPLAYTFYCSIKQLNYRSSHKLTSINTILEKYKCQKITFRIVCTTVSSWKCHSIYFSNFWYVSFVKTFIIIMQLVLCTPLFTFIVRTSNLVIVECVHQIPLSATFSLCVASRDCCRDRVKQKHKVESPSGHVRFR